MDKIVIKGYKDFNKIVKKLNEDKVIKLDLSTLKFNLRTRILDLIVGYTFDKGSIKKETRDTFIVSLV